MNVIGSSNHFPGFASPIRTLSVGSLLDEYMKLIQRVWGKFYLACQANTLPVRVNHSKYASVYVFCYPHPYFLKCCLHTQSERTWHSNNRPQPLGSAAVTGQTTPTDRARGKGSALLFHRSANMACISARVNRTRQQHTATTMDAIGRVREECCR